MIPSRDSVSRAGLDDVYESVLHNIKIHILTDNAFQLAITFRLWTDSYRRLNYITFTLHYLTDDFELKTFTLKTELMEGVKSGEKIQKAVNETKKEFAITDKKLCSVTDAGTNVKRALTLANIDHNLVIVDEIKKLQKF
ncbi:unnamed protein product [Parnassius apollo]|uniref:(apollo) hypothetical protein n=1 Tax=Parnassius apollo TaxID=110799 RepID=A0A8S3XHD5_PARAO|nr:unnamed protein product [Parnassius apollo]